MIIVTEDSQIEKYRSLLSEMTEDGIEFSERWLNKTGWVVVPAESGGRLWPEDLPRIVSALNDVGQARSLAVTTEDLGGIPPCYIVSVDEADFRELNREQVAQSF